MNILKRIICIILVTFMTSCSVASQSLTSNRDFMKNTANDRQSLSGLIDAVNKSGLEIFKRRVKNDSNGNVIISPVSIFSAFSLLSNGADGKTKEQISRALYIDRADIKKVNEDMNSLMNNMNYSTGEEDTGSINIYNSIWFNKDFKIRESFINISKSYYDSDVYKRDFSKKSTLDDMNAWADKKSDGLISKPFQNLSKENRMIIVNLLNFKGKWTSVFDKSQTKEEKFYLKDNSPVNINMMNKESFMSFYEDREVKAGVLNYYNGRMIVLLPNDNIDNYIKKLNAEKIKSYKENASYSKVMLKLPKFDVEYKEDISGILKQMGVKNAFSPNSASFSLLHEDKQPLWIGNVLHDCVIKVDEEGTSGAALTSVMLCGAAFPKDVHELYINRPFVFIIEDRGGTCLFIGKVENLK